MMADVTEKEGSCKLGLSLIFNIAIQTSFSPTTRRYLRNPFTHACWYSLTDPGRMEG